MLDTFNHGLDTFDGTSQERLKREQEEKDVKKKEKAEAHLYTIIKVAATNLVSKQPNVWHYC